MTRTSLEALGLSEDIDVDPESLKGAAKDFETAAGPLSRAANLVGGITVNASDFGKVPSASTLATAVNTEPGQGRDEPRHRRQGGPPHLGAAQRQRPDLHQHRRLRGGHDPPSRHSLRPPQSQVMTTLPEAPAAATAYASSALASAKRCETTRSALSPHRARRSSRLGHVPERGHPRAVQRDLLVDEQVRDGEVDPATLTDHDTAPACGRVGQRRETGVGVAAAVERHLAAASVGGVTDGIGERVGVRDDDVDEAQAPLREKHARRWARVR